MKLTPIEAWVVSGDLPKNGEGTTEALQRLSCLEVTKRKIVQSSPLDERFSCWLDESGEQVRGHIFFSPNDVDQILAAVLAPIKARIERERAIVEGLEAKRGAINEKDIQV